MHYPSFGQPQTSFSEAAGFKSGIETGKDRQHPLISPVFKVLHQCLFQSSRTGHPRTPLQNQTIPSSSHWLPTLYSKGLSKRWVDPQMHRPSIWQPLGAFLLVALTVPVAHFAPAPWQAAIRSWGHYPFLTTIFGIVLQYYCWLSWFIHYVYLTIYLQMRTDYRHEIRVSQRRCGCLGRMSDNRDCVEMGFFLATN